MKLFIDPQATRIPSDWPMPSQKNLGAIWARHQPGEEGYLAPLLSLFHSTGLKPCLWHASPGRSLSAKIRAAQRSFGPWRIPRRDVFHRHTRPGLQTQLTPEPHEVYSDIAHISDNGIKAAEDFLADSLFGISSALFFLKPDTGEGELNALRQLLDQYLDQHMDSHDKNQPFHERKLLMSTILDLLLSLGGIASIRLRDTETIPVTLFLTGNVSIWEEMGEITLLPPLGSLPETELERLLVHRGLYWR